MRILAIERMLKTDKYITAPEIIKNLDLVYDIQCNRQAIYNDMYAIDRFIPLEIKPGKNGGFRILKQEDI